MRTAASLLLFLTVSAVKGAAPAGPVDVRTESARFTILQDGKKIGQEDFSISTRRGGGYIAEATTKLKDESTPIKCRMELDDQLRPISYEYHKGTGVIKMKIDTPLSEYETGNGDKTASVSFRFPEDGFIVDHNFFHHIELLLYKVGRKAGETAIVVPQNMTLGSVTVRPKDSRTFDLEMGDVKMQATIDPNDGRLLRLTAPAAKVVIER
ncbi:MAG TPA: hypothetical protein VFY29_02020 [Terriglobia bacterium]|nr:hypothetical protein [Terriglobia bacterium]